MDFKKMADIIVTQLNAQLTRSISKNAFPSPNWNLEDVIVQALAYVEKKTEQRVNNEVSKLIQDFDSEDGSIVH